MKKPQNVQYWGTSNFPSMRAAILYYKDTEGEFVTTEIIRKIKEKSIVIGEKPKTTVNQKVFVRDNRYWIEEIKP